MSKLRRWPDAYVTATDRNGRVLDRIELRRGVTMQDRIGQAKRTLIERHGPETYTFVNVYC